MEWYYVWWPCLTYKRLAQVRRHKLSFLFLTVRPLWSVMQDRFSPPLGQPMPFYSSHANSKQAWRMCIFIADKFAKCPKICDCVKFIRGCMSGLLLQAWKKDLIDMTDWLRPFALGLKNKNLSYRWQTARRIVQYAMAWLTRLKHAPPRMCYHAEFGRYLR